MEVRQAIQMFSTLFLAVAVLLSTAPAWTEDDEEDIAKTLIFGDWQDFMKKGKIELVLNPEYGYFRDGSDGEQQATFNLELETFPGENWELELELEGIKYLNGDGEDSETDIGKVELSLEYRFLHNLDPVFDLRIGVEVSQPLSSVDEGINVGFRRWGPKFTGRTKIGPVHLFVKVAYEFLEHDNGDDDEDHDVLEYQLAFFYPKNNWRFGAEIFGETNEVGGGNEHDLFLTPEVRYRLGEGGGGPDDVEFGLGFPIGLTDDADDWGVFFQVYLGFDLRHGEPAGRDHRFWRRN